MPEPTYYAKILIEKLAKRGIKAIPEYNDGHKSVDIHIPEANIDIEVDGSHHYHDPIQALKDLLRTKHSMLNGKETIRIPNTLIYKSLSQTADLIEEIVKDRIKKKNIGKRPITKQITLEQTLPKETIEKYKIKFNMAKAKKVLYEYRKRRIKKILKYSILLLFLFFISILIFIHFNNDSSIEPVNNENDKKIIVTPTIISENNKSENNPRKDEDRKITYIPPVETKTFSVEGSKTDVIIKNELDRSISLNITYRIYSNWFGKDSQTSDVFQVGANEKKSFKVYDNTGCSTAPCSVTIISYEEI